MKKITKVLSKSYFLLLGVLLLSGGLAFGQSNPTPHNLGASDYSFDGFAVGTTTTYPTSMQGWSFSSEATSAITTAPTADRVLVASTATASSGSIRNEVSNGISLLNSGSNNIGAICVSLDATGREDLLATWTAAEIGSNGARSNALVLQYRIGTSGSFTTIAGTTYTTNQAQSNTAPQTFTNIAIPADANNESVVQLRWLYYYVSGSGGRDRIGLDDITVSSSEISAGPSPTITSSINSLDGFSYTAGSGPSSAQIIEISGADLTADISSTTGTDFEFSLDDVSYSASLADLEETSGTVATTDIYVRLAAGRTAGLYSENITFSSTDATDVVVTLEGEVIAACTLADDATDFMATAGDTEVTLDWTNGVCYDEYLVVGREGSAVTATPSGDGSGYFANALFSLGTDIGIGEYAIYKGTGTTASTFALTNDEIYHFTIFGRLGTNWSTGVSVSAMPQIPPPPPSCIDLFFSEYIEGTSNNKYLEIYNPTDAIVDLSSYAVNLYTNGSPTVSTSVSLTGSLSPYSTFVMAHSSATLYGGTPDYSINGGVLNFNGDDAISLMNNDVIIDVIGQIGVDPGTAWTGSGCSTLDRTLVRKITVGLGDNDGSNVFDPSIEWDCYDVNEISFLGSHSSDCAAGAPLITANPNFVNDLNYVEGEGPSFSQFFTVSGIDLNSDISATTATNFEFSLDDITYNPNLADFEELSGEVAETTVYVRLVEGLAVGTYSSEITLSSTDAADVIVSFAGSVSPAPAAPCTELFISEYIEGSSNNKYIEIYNPTDATVDLTDYALVVYSNGSPTVSNSLDLVGTISAYSVFVVAHSSATIYNGTPDQTVNGGALGFNGDDAVALQKDGLNIDVIGQIGFDPGSEWTGGGCSTINRTLVRKTGITSGDINGADVFDPSIEWDCFDEDDESNLGEHFNECAPIPCTLELSGSTTTATIGFSNGSATVVASGGAEPYSYLWNDPFEQTDETALGLFPGTYTCVVTDANDCVESIELTVTLDLQNTTRLKTQFCDGTYAFSDAVSCEPAFGAQNYRWELTPVGGSPLPEYTRGYANRNLRLSWVSGIELGTTYEVRVKAFIDGEWGEYSEMCTINTGTDIPFTQLAPSYSPINPTTNSPYVLCNNLLANYTYGAQMFEWELTGSETLVAQSPSYFIKLSTIPGIQMNTVYEVRVRALVDGQWGTFGVQLPIQIGTPANTQLVASQCGTTRALNQGVAAINNCGASSYIFRFQHGSEAERIVVRPAYTCPLWQVQPPLTPGETYSVTVKVTQGGVDGDYSTACDVTIAGPQAEGLADDMILSKVAAEGALGIYPNPNAGSEVRVELDGIEDGAHNVEVTIYDIYGKLMTRDVFGHQGSQLSRLVRFETELATGMYLVHVTIDGETYITNKMVVK